MKLEPKDTNAWEDTVWLLWSLSINKKNVRYLDTAEKVVLDYLKHNNNGYRAYEYVGLFEVEVFPSPKFQAQVETPAALGFVVLVKFMVLFAQDGVVNV